MYELRTMFLRQKHVVNSLMKLAPDGLADKVIVFAIVFIQQLAQETIT